ncbi:MAG: exopolysaccharide biosynthesis polyprenyl glycosylphosphotransferase [Lewinella sp.]|nr:exopolysaccharide biosynthesis polyprenyl glycosylphosphotransferase [Lewinella sp.]
MLLNACLLGGLSYKMPMETLMGQHPWELLFFILASNATAGITVGLNNIFQAFEGLRINLKFKDLLIGTMVYLGIMSLVYYQFFFPVFEVHFLLPSLGLFLVLTTALHYLANQLSKNLNPYFTYAVIGGEASSIHYLEKCVESAYGKRTYCIGRFADNDISEVDTLGDYREVKDFLKQQPNINKLMYLGSKLPQQEVQDIARACRDQFVDFEVIPQASPIFSSGMAVTELAGVPVLQRRREPLNQIQNRLLKRIFDIMFSSLVIVLVFPWLLPIIALAIRLESRGPIFFSQKRTGYRNRAFNCLKFRSMRVNGDSDNKQAVRNDSRITRVGSFLRKTSLDEFPQFLNVFMGDMSVVGPRPHMLKHTEEYAELIDSFMFRHAVKPGVTGWAQINGWRGPTPEVYQMEKRVEYDVDYIENWNFWLDMKCVFFTVWNIFRGEKNAF